MTKDHKDDHQHRDHEAGDKAEHRVPGQAGPEKNPYAGVNVPAGTSGEPILDPATEVQRQAQAFGQDVYDQEAVEKAQGRVNDAHNAAAETLGKEGAKNPLKEPVDIGKDDRGLDMDVRVDPADNRMKTFVSNHTDGEKDPDTGEKTPADQLPHKAGEKPDTRRRGDHDKD